MIDRPPFGSPLECCIAWQALGEEDRRTWRYQALHQLCHSSVPFSMRQLIAATHVDEQTAAHLWVEAIERCWAVPHRESDLLIGKLQRRSS